MASSKSTSCMAWKPRNLVKYSVIIMIMIMIIVVAVVIIIK